MIVKWMSGLKGENVLVVGSTITIVGYNANSEIKLLTLDGGPADTTGFISATVTSHDPNTGEVRFELTK